MSSRELALDEAAAYLRLSGRHVRRLVEELRRGFRPDSSTATAESDRRTGSRTRWQRVVEFARTVRRILAAATVALLRTGRSTRRRPRWEPMPRAVMFLQTDGVAVPGSRTGPILTLVGGIDDAANAVTIGTFRFAEDAAEYLLMLCRTITPSPFGDVKCPV